MIDPLAEKYLSTSIYSYCFSNPIRFIDPTGMSATRYEDEEGTELLTTNDGNNSTITVQNDQRDKFDNKVQEMKKEGSLDSKQSNVELIDEVTPDTKGVFFTDSQMAWMYMTNNSIENIAWTTTGGVVTEPTKAFNFLTGNYNENTLRDAFFNLPQHQKGSSLYVVLNGKEYKVNSMVHDHPFVPGGMNDLANVFSPAPEGDIGIYNSFKDRGIQMGMYLIGPNDVVKYTIQTPNKVVGGTFGLLNGANIIK